MIKASNGTVHTVISNEQIVAWNTKFAANNLSGGIVIIELRNHTPKISANSNTNIEIRACIVSAAPKMFLSSDCFPRPISKAKTLWCLYHTSIDDADNNY